MPRMIICATAATPYAMSWGRFGIAFPWNWPAATSAKYGPKVTAIASSDNQAVFSLYGMRTLPVWMSLQCIAYLT
jgi:hypothetical protein